MTEYDTETTVVKAVEEAVKLGHLHILRWLYDNFSARTFWKEFWDSNVVENCNLETAQWLHEHIDPPNW